MTVLLELIHAYLEDYRHLLTQPADVEIGVSTSDDPEGW